VQGLQSLTVIAVVRLPMSHKKLDEKDDSKHYKPLAKLLVVDDDSDITHVIKQGLVQKRFLVDAFTDSEEALQKFQSYPKDHYCLMLSDIRMPGISGIKLARKVKELNPNVKVILMTSFEIKDNEFSKVFPSTQVDGFIQKPVHLEYLTNKILDTIGQTKRRLKRVTK
jgi:DNA-binding NtrC family response regulator